MATIAALLAFAVCSPALAQEEAPGVKEYCADAAPAADQYGCEEPRSPDCAPQQQYADDGTGGCVVDPYQDDLCTGNVPCSTAQAQDGQADNITEVLPPASVQNVVVAAANSVSKSAPEASRALDTAEPVEPADNVALAAEGEPVAEPIAYPPEAPEEATGEDAAYPPEAPEEAAGEGATPALAAAAPDTATAPAQRTPAEPTKATQPIEPPKATEVVADQERALEEVDGDPAASHEIAPVDRFVVPLFALGGSTLLIFGGLLIRRIVG